MYTDEPRESGVTGPQFTKLFTPCSQIIAAVNAPIGIAIFQSVSKCESGE